MDDLERHLLRASDSDACRNPLSGGHPGPSWRFVEARQVGVPADTGSQGVGEGPSGGGAHHIIPSLLA